MKTLIIAFGYKARHGKDTAVQAIIDARKDQFDVRRYSFGDFLKAEVAGREFELCMQYGIPYEPDNKHRSLLQWYGTDFRRKQDPNYWVKKLARKIAEEQPLIALISDIRFLNEFAWVTSKDGTTVKVDRLGYTNLANNPTHASECDLDGVVFDYEIQVQDGDVEELKKDSIYVFDMVVAAMAPPDLSDIATPVVIEEGK